jgi:hypothetical protein
MLLIRVEVLVQVNSEVTIRATVNVVVEANDELAVVFWAGCREEIQAEDLTE